MSNTVDPRQLVLRFERARDENPMTEAEARAELAAQGVDVDAEYARLLERLAPSGS